MRESDDEKSSQLFTCVVRACARDPHSKDTEEAMGGPWCWRDGPFSRVAECTPPCSLPRLVQKVRHTTHRLVCARALCRVSLTPSLTWAFVPFPSFFVVSLLLHPLPVSSRSLSQVTFLWCSGRMSLRHDCFFRTRDRAYRTCASLRAPREFLPYSVQILDSTVDLRQLSLWFHLQTMSS